MKWLLLLSFFSVLSFSNPCFRKLDEQKIIKDIGLLKEAFPFLEDFTNLPINTQVNIIYKKLWELEEQGILKKKLSQLVDSMKSSKLIPNLENLSDEFIVNTLYQVFSSEFYARGLINPDYKFMSWNEIYEWQYLRLNRLEKTTSFKTSSFKKVFEKITGDRFASAQNLKYISKNSKALAKRLEMISSAKKSIKLMTWGFQNDNSAALVADALIRKRREGVKVRLIVDYLTSLVGSNGAQLKRLEEAGVEVVYFKGKENPYYGMHAKMLLVDENKTLEGGRNIGKKYLKDDYWLDLDVYHEGLLSEVDNYNIFAHLWNEQVQSQKLPFKKLKKKRRSTKDNNYKFASILSRPDPRKSDIISDLTIYSIMNAKKSIDIINAYVILTPALRDALESAIKRGVRVRVISNSTTSVDEPIVSIPISQSLRELFHMGAEVYLKQGETLHSKSFRVDDMTVVTSYNFHPRSGRLEVEKAFVSIAEESKKEFKKKFKISKNQSTKVTKVEDFNLPAFENKLELLFTLIFNQL